MELSVLEAILKAYAFPLEGTKIAQIGSGLINRTYLLSSQNESYILQCLNTNVFKDPFAIANNIEKVATYLNHHYPDYLFPAPVVTTNRALLFHHQNEFWRLQPYVANSIALNTLDSTEQAYEAAKQFGKLTRLLTNFDTSLLKSTIPHFHDLALRYEQFLEAKANANTRLTHTARNEISAVLTYQNLISEYEIYKNSLDFPNRVIHHDTKISNVLLSAISGEGMCVIDLDTLMPGKITSDFGDMMRTYLCEFSENETNFEKIKIRLPYFKAMLDGYLSEMKEMMTPLERQLLIFSGKYMIFMQALRFLTDYLNGNSYFLVNYPMQNLDRARNQFKLLSDIYEKEPLLQSIVDEHFK